MNHRKRRKLYLEKWWMKGLTSLDVGRKVRIVPRWETHARSNDRVNIVIEPGPAFGGGDHPSTVMALELLEIALERVQRSCDAPSVLDVGTGTGVLAIAAKSLGAGAVMALDIDFTAIFTISRKNAELNELNWQRNTGHPLCFFVGDIAAVSSRFEIVLANLAAPVLLRLRDDLTSAASCCLILSGIADEMVSEVQESYCSSMSLYEFRKKRGWNALLLGKR